MYGQSSQPCRKTSQSHMRLKAVLRDLSSDEESDYEDNMEESNTDPKKPWLAEFHRYLNSSDYIDEDMSIVQWWGVSLITGPSPL